jgi:cytochrome c-type biogenesis protein CcmE
MKRKTRRLVLIATCGAVLAGAVGVALSSVSDSIVFFRMPSEIITHPPAPGTRLRLGGLVAKGSVVHHGDRTTFEVTDGRDEVPVTYTGLLPDLFREGQGVVAEGVMATGGTFRADTVLAKHDATYMPPQVAAALKKRGLWKPSESAE